MKSEPEIKEMAHRLCHLRGQSPEGIVYVGRAPKLRWLVVAEEIRTFLELMEVTK